MEGKVKMTRPIPMTLAGRKRLEEELKRLKSVERPQNIRDIEEARGHGDLSENAEYHAAKERQAFLSVRIAELEDKVARAQVIDSSKMETSKILFGAVVTLVNTETGEEKVYQIVGADEADVRQGRISVESPIARSLLGREQGAVVQVGTPRGLMEFEIQNIRYE